MGWVVFRFRDPGTNNTIGDIEHQARTLAGTLINNPTGGRRSQFGPAKAFVRAKTR
jgi:hypothetical protein